MHVLCASELKWRTIHACDRWECSLSRAFMRRAFWAPGMWATLPRGPATGWQTPQRPTPPKSSSSLMTAPSRTLTCPGCSAMCLTRLGAPSGVHVSFYFSLEFISSSISLQCRCCSNRPSMCCAVSLYSPRDLRTAVNTIIRRSGV